MFFVTRWLTTIRVRTSNNCSRFTLDLYVRNTRVVLRRTFHDPYTCIGQVSRVPPSYVYVYYDNNTRSSSFLTVNMTYIRSVHLLRSNDINDHLTHRHHKSSPKTGNMIISLRRRFRALGLTTTGGHVSPRLAHKILCADVIVYQRIYWMCFQTLKIHEFVHEFIGDCFFESQHSILLFF